MIGVRVQVTDTLNQSRAFATVTVPSAGVPNIVAIATIAKQLRSGYHTTVAVADRNVRG